MCVIIVAKVVSISQMIVTHFAQSTGVDAHHVGQFIHPFALSVGRSEVADSCHHMIPDKLGDDGSVEIMLDEPVP